jgi:hypothetical protein
MGLDYISILGYGFHINRKGKNIKGTFWDDLDELIGKINEEFNVKIYHQEDSYDDDLPIFIYTGGFENRNRWGCTQPFNTNSLELTFKVSEKEDEAISNLINILKKQNWLEIENDTNKLIGWYVFNCCR